MTYPNKWERDFIQGKEKNKSALAYLNKLIEKDGMCLKRVHDCLREEMSIAEKKNNNILRNRSWWNSPIVEKAMGLDWFLMAQWANCREIIIPRFNTNRDLYYKLANDISAEGFINDIVPNVYILLLSKDFSKYDLRRGSDYTWTKAEWKGNKNRIYAAHKHKSISPKNVVLTDVMGRSAKFDAIPLSVAFRKLLEESSQKGGQK